MIDKPTIAKANLDSLSDYSFQLNQWFLKPIGAWPALSPETKLEKIFSSILIFSCYFCVLITVIPCMLYLILDEDDLEKKLRMLGPLSHWFVGGVNYTALLLRGKKIRCCVEHMRTDWRAVKELKDRSCSKIHGSVVCSASPTMIAESIVKQSNLDSLSDYSLQLNRWFLKPIGAWPASPPKSRVNKILSSMLIFSCYFCVLITVIPCILYLILDEDDLEKKLRMLGPLSHWFVGGINYTALLLRGNKIRSCVEQVQTDWRTVTRSEDMRIMLRDAKFGRYAMAFCAAFMQGGVLCYCAATAFTVEVTQVENETRTWHTLPCAAYRKLIPVDTSPTNEIFIVLQFWSCFIVNSSAVGAFSLAIMFAAHAYGQLDVLMMWITEIVNGSKQKVRLNETSFVVENHLKILRFISHIEDIMNGICFMELFKCTVSICMLEYHIIMDLANQDYQRVPGYMLVFCSMTFNIFIVCYVGEKLSEQCQKVGEAVYMTNWYHLPKNEILNLILIISRSRMVTKLTAGKIIEMSFFTFVNVMKTAFAYLNILRQTT